MSGLRGLVAGTIGLALLEVVVSNTDAAGRVGGIFDTSASILSRWLDPYTPLIPNLHDNGTPSPFGPNGPSSGPITDGPGLPGVPNVPGPHPSIYQPPKRATAPAPQPAVPH